MNKKISIFLIVALVGLVLAFTMKAQNKNKPITVGDKVPDFILLDQNGKEFNVGDYAGKRAMVIYFYPKDDTPGCTKEACSFRDSFEEFTDRNVEVVGISADSVESHLNFAKKYNLPFSLLADTENKVRNLFGVKGNLMGLIPGRVTYVINKEGIVVYVFESQLKATKHIDESLKALDAQS